jgi:hypothetical protein
MNYKIINKIMDIRKIGLKMKNFILLGLLLAPIGITMQDKPVVGKDFWMGVKNALLIEGTVGAAIYAGVKHEPLAIALSASLGYLLYNNIKNIKSSLIAPLGLTETKYLVIFPQELKIEWQTESEVIKDKNKRYLKAQLKEIHNDPTVKAISYYDDYYIYVRRRLSVYSTVG